MRRARATDGERLFLVGVIPVPPADISFFHACRVRKQPVTDQDVLAVKEKVKFCSARDPALSSLQIYRPIVVDQHDICALLKS